MNYRRIEYFLAVVDAGTVTSAADNLHLAQPALSRQLKTLERELKLELFETQGNRLALTPAGRAFVPAARRLMMETQGLEEAADTLRTGRITTLTVAATASSVRGFIAPFIATTGVTDPVIITRETSHYDVADALLRGADIAISPAAPGTGLRTHPLGSIPLTAYVAPDHEWAQHQIASVMLSDMRGSHAILPSRHSVSRSILDDALSQSRLAFRKISECDDGQTIMALAAAGHGVGITTDRPAFGAYPVRILADQANTAENPRLLQLPLHAAWISGHFAEESIGRIAQRIGRFLAEQGAVLPLV